MGNMNGYGSTKKAGYYALLGSDKYLNGLTNYYLGFLTGGLKNVII